MYVLGRPGGVSEVMCVRTGEQRVQVGGVRWKTVEHWPLAVEKFGVLIMVALCNRADHYIFAL